MKTHLLPAFRSRLGLGPIALAVLVVLGAAIRCDAQGLNEVPGPAVQAEARKLVEAVFGELLNAKTDDDRAAAARVLILRADETRDSPAAKYVMYETARSLAVEAGDARAAMDAIDGLAAAFEDTPGPGGGYLGLASASLQDLSRKVRTDPQHAQVAQAGLLVAERMITAKREDDAAALLARLRSSATRSKRPELTSAYKEMTEELRVIRDEEKRIAADLKAYEANPEDPALSLSVGKFLSLYRGDWLAGLPLLARSSDAALSAAAKLDLAGAVDAKAQIAIGDRWWALSEQSPWIEQRSLADRARYWYRKALPGSSGIERAVLTMRLSPSGQVKWGDLVLEPGIRTWVEVDGDAKNLRPGPVAKESSWEIKTKPAGAEKTVVLHFEGYLYSQRYAEVGLVSNTDASWILVEVNGRAAVSGNGKSEAPVHLIKGYNIIRGSISVPVVYIDNPDLLPKATLTLSEFDGKTIAIPAEHWFHDATK